MYSISSAASYIPSNYYQQMERRMSYSDYLSCSSQGSFSDYEHSPVTLSEEYPSPSPSPSTTTGHHHQQQKYFVPSMSNVYSYHPSTLIPPVSSHPFDCMVEYHQHMMFKQPQPVYDSMYNHHHHHYQHHASDASSPTPSSTSTANSSPIASPKMPCQANNSTAAPVGGGKKKVTKSTRAKRNAVSRVTKQQKQHKQQAEDDASLKTFSCEHYDCGKVFKRSEHLKRHIRSIHTREKRKLNFKP